MKKVITKTTVGAVYQHKDGTDYYRLPIVIVPEGTKFNVVYLDKSPGRGWNYNPYMNMVSDSEFSKKYVKTESGFGKSKIDKILLTTLEAFKAWDKLMLETSQSLKKLLK